MIIRTIAAVIPAIILLAKVYKADRLEKEPKGLLISLGFMGLLSTFTAGIAELVCGGILARFVPEKTLIYNIIEYFLIVAFAEEGSKYFFLKIRTWKSPNFNCSFDGVVYSVFVSLGFALFENIGYVIQFGISNAVARAFTAVPAHACFGVFMGVWYAAAKRWSYRGNSLRVKACKIKALLIPAFLHGAYDFLATVQADAATVAWIVFVLIMFIIAYRKVKQTAAADEYIDYNQYSFSDFMNNIRM